MPRPASIVVRGTDDAHQTPLKQPQPLRYDGPMSPGGTRPLEPQPLSPREAQSPRPRPMSPTQDERQLDDQPELGALSPARQPQAPDGFAWATPLTADARSAKLPYPQAPDYLLAAAVSDALGEARDESRDLADEMKKLIREAQEPLVQVRAVAALRQNEQSPLVGGVVRWGYTATAKAVFAEPECRNAILLHCPPIVLWRLRRVCRGFRDGWSSEALLLQRKSKPTARSVLLRDGRNVREFWLHHSKAPSAVWLRAKPFCAAPYHTRDDEIVLLQVGLDGGGRLCACTSHYLRPPRFFVLDDPTVQADKDGSVAELGSCHEMEEAVPPPSDLPFKWRRGLWRQFADVRDVFYAAAEAAGLEVVDE